MKLFLISQKQNNNYDTFDSAVVAAQDEETARNTSPLNGKPIYTWGGTWCSGPEHVIVEYIGEADWHIESGLICASFNAS